MKGVEHFRTARNFFHQDRGCAHHGRGDNPLLVWHFVQRQQVDGAVPRHRLLRHEFPQRGVTSTARAEHGGTEGNFV